MKICMKYLYGWYHDSCALAGVASYTVPGPPVYDLSLSTPIHDSRCCVACVFTHSAMYHGDVGQKGGLKQQGQKSS